MISLYSGTPGSGKSLHIARRIYYTLRDKRPVIANFEVKREYIRKKRPEKLRFTYIPNDELTPERLIEFSAEYFRKRIIREDTILLVIDEAQIIFNSRAWQQSGRSQWLSFFSQHRKYGYEIVLIAQFDGMIDKQIRTLIEYNYIHRKMSNFGLVGKIMSLFWLGKAFCAVKMWYPLNERLSSEIFSARKKFYRIYDTWADFGTKKALTDSQGLKSSKSDSIIDSAVSIESGQGLI